MRVKAAATPPLGRAEQTNERGPGSNREMRRAGVAADRHLDCGVDIAGRMGIARQRLYERLDSVHRQVMGFLQDIAIGA